MNIFKFNVHNIIIQGESKYVNTAMKEMEELQLCQYFSVLLQIDDPDV